MVVFFAPAYLQNAEVKTELQKNVIRQVIPASFTYLMTTRRNKSYQSVVNSLELKQPNCFACFLLYQATFALLQANINYKS